MVDICQVIWHTTPMTTLFPFAVTFRTSPRATTTQQWTRFYPSLQHAYADVATHVQAEYPNAPIGSIDVALHLGFFPNPAFPMPVGGF